MIGLSDVLSFFGLLNSQSSAVSERRARAAELLAEIHGKTEELYWQAQHDFELFVVSGTTEGLSDLEEAIVQLQNIRARNAEHFAHLEKANSFSLRKWDRLLQHLERQNRTLDSVAAYYRNNIVLPPAGLLDGAEDD